MSLLLSNAANRAKWAIWAPFYDTFVSFSAQRRRSIESLHLQAGERVLIPGCGTGADLPCIPAGVKISASDLSRAMMAHARSRADALGVDVDFRTGDACHLDFPDASFDAVILHLIISIVDDPIACIREAERVLKPGGRIAVFDKIMPDGRPPSLFRRGLNVVMRFLATDINRDLSKLVAATSLQRVSDQPAMLRGVFRAAILRKT